MNKILFLAHTEENDELSRLTLESLTAAKKMSAELNIPLLVGIIGDNIEKTKIIASAAPEAIFTIQGEEFKYSRYSSDALAIETICKEVAPTYIVAPATSRFSRVLPGVAHRLSGEIDTFVSALSIDNNKLFITRWYYRQRMYATLTRTKTPWIMTIAPGNFEKFEGSEQDFSFTNLTPTSTDTLMQTKIEGFVSPNCGKQTLKPEAELLFVAGAGWSKKQSDGNTKLAKAAELILDFLNKTDASLGGSKSVVDMSSEGEEALSFMTHLNQVGQTGATPSHKKGLSTCCHGEEPHAVGWRFINERRAVNLDPNCGWAQGKADVLYVADAFAVIEKVNKILSYK